MSHLILIGTVPLANYESLMNSINDNNYRLDSKELYPSASAPPEYLVSDYDYLHLRKNNFFLFLKIFNFFDL